MVVKRGSGYIKETSKSTVGKRSIDDRAEPSVIRRYQITAYTDGLLSQLALVSGSSKGEALELAVQLYGFAYCKQYVLWTLDQRQKLFLAYWLGFFPLKKYNNHSKWALFVAYIPPTAP